MIKSSITVSLITVLLAILMIIALTGCPGQQSEEDENGSGQTAQTDSDENANMAEGTRMNGDGIDSREPPPDDRFQPTQEQPLAPPAREAAGVESIPQGELGMAVSMLDYARGLLAVGKDVSVFVGTEIKVQVTVVNNTDEAREFVFPTSQKLDIHFSDPQGNAVYQWSAGKRFATVVNSLTLEAGDRWSHELTVPVGSGSEKLAPGTYIVNVMLTGTPPISFMASNVEIKITE
ncbi:MAG TPA: hypothetical protein ENN67_05400 [Firmicutes bacterium]|nr:hypothetical protein [Bacillota bacterium]